MADQVIHSYPNALLVFVNGFRPKEIPEDKDITVVSTFENAPKELASVNVSVTVKNSPGTFNVTLIDTANRFILPDEADTEVSELYIRSTGKVQYTNKEQTSTTGTFPNVYEFENLQKWLAFEWGTIESADTGERSVVYYRRSSATTIAERYAFNRAGDVIYVVARDDEEQEKAFQAATSGDVFYYPIVTEKNKKTAGVYFLYKNQNKEFFTRYRDTEEQGDSDTTFKRGRCKIAPMDRVVIFLTQRFSNEDNTINQSSKNQMIRVFTGLVNTVEQSYSNNQNVINISGEDVTKFLRMSVININPALIYDPHVSPDSTKNNPISMWRQIFLGMTAPEILKRLLLGGTVGEHTESGTSRILDAVWEFQIATIGDSQNIVYNPDTNTLEKVPPPTDANPGKGKKEEPVRMASLEGMLGDLFHPPRVHILNPFRKEVGLEGFRPYELALNGGWSLYNAEFKTRRDLAYQVAEDTHFVFYADRNGDIWFHPPRFSNAHILGAKNPNVYIIDTEDIISYGFIEDDSNVFSSVYVDTEPDFQLQGAQELGVYRGAYKEETVMLKYGQRILTVSNPIIRTGDKQHLTMYAKSLLQRLLAGKYQGQITIIGRAEIDPGRPVYVPIRNMIYYVESIDHSLSFGNSYQTTLHLSYGRKPWEMLPEILTFSENDEVYLTDHRAGGKATTKEKKEEAVSSFKGAGFPPTTTTKPSYAPTTPAIIDSTFVAPKPLGFPRAPDTPSIKSGG